MALLTYEWMRSFYVLSIRIFQVNWSPYPPRNQPSGHTFQWIEKENESWDHSGQLCNKWAPSEMEMEADVRDFSSKGLKG